MKSAAIVGCGKPPPSVAGHKVGWGIGSSHAEGYRLAFPNIDLYAVDPNADNLRAFADKWSIPLERCHTSTKALYKSHIPDCVSICTWPALHVPEAMEAAKANVKLLVVEKPVGLDGYEVQTLMDLARAGNVRIAIAHQRRYEPGYVAARKFLMQGEIGEKLVFEGRVGDDWDILSWTVHWFDMASYLLDALPVSVLAGVDHTGKRRYGHAVENASVIFADYGPNKQAIFVTGPQSIAPAPVTIRGEKGMLAIFGKSLKIWSEKGYREDVCDDPDFHSPYANLITDLWNNREGGISRCDISQCALATQMAYAAHESARTERIVTLPLDTWFAPLEVLQHPPVRARTKSLSIVLLADEHHEWRVKDELPMSGRFGLADALLSLGHQVKLLDAREELPVDVLDDADLLVIYHTQREIRPQDQAAIAEWFGQGRPVLVSHCGIGAYPNWPEFRRWIGRYWVWRGEALSPSHHPFVSCEQTVLDQVRFRSGWQTSWLPSDEMYQNLGESSDIIPLVDAKAPDGTTQVYAWQVSANPNVVVFLPGHRRDMFTLENVRSGLSACIELACDGRK